MAQESSKTNYCKQKGKLCVWYYTEEFLEHRKGWELFADKEGTNSLIAILNEMETCLYDTKRTLKNGPFPFIGENMKIFVPEKLVLDFVAQASEDLWEIVESANSVEFRFSKIKLDEFIGTLRHYLEGSDLSIWPENEHMPFKNYKERRRHRTKNSLYFVVLFTI